VLYTQTANSTNLALFINFLEEDISSKVPKLIAGDLVYIDFSNYKGSVVSNNI